MPGNFPKLSFLLSIGFLLSSLAGFIFVVNAGQQNYNTLLERQSSWQEELSRRQGIKKLENLVKNVSREGAELAVHFVPAANVVPFLDTIEDLAKISGVKAEVSTVEVSEEQNGLNVIVNASGTFGNNYKFLRLLEDSPYIVTFSGMEFHKEGSSNKAALVEAGKWNAVFKMKLLSYLP